MLCQRTANYVSLFEAILRILKNLCRRRKLLIIIFFSWYPLCFGACISADASTFWVTSMTCKPFVIPARYLCIAGSVRTFYELLLGHELSCGESARQRRATGIIELAVSRARHFLLRFIFWSGRGLVPISQLVTLALSRWLGARLSAECKARTGDREAPLIFFQILQGLGASFSLSVQ